MELFVVKTLGGFKPAYSSDYEKIKKLNQNEEYKCTISLPRNIKFHRKYFALIKLFFSNQEIYSNIDDLRHDLTILSGYYIEYVDFNGEIRKRPKSIKFSSMDEDEFNKLYNDTLDIIVKLLNTDKEQILNEVTSFY